MNNVNNVVEIFMAALVALMIGIQVGMNINFSEVQIKQVVNYTKDCMVIRSSQECHSDAMKMLDNTLRYELNSRKGIKFD